MLRWWRDLLHAIARIAQRPLAPVIHHAWLMHRDGVIRAEDIQLPPQRLPSRLGDEPPTDGQALLARAFARPFETGDAALHATVKEQLFRAAYRHCDQNQVRTAALLGVSRNVVRARLIALGELVVNTRSG